MKIKKRVLLCSILFLLYGSAFAQEVAQIQQSLITKRTATWCPYCGSWGWDFFEDLQANTSDKAVLIAAHFGGSALENTASIDIVNNFGSSSQPKFFVNNELQVVTSGNLPSALAVVEAKVDDNYLAAPLANVGLETVWDGNNLEVKTKTRFFQPANATYHLGLYLVEDKVLAAQASQSGQVDHMRVLRAAVTPNTFGDQIASGPIDAGTEYTGTYPVSLSGYDLDNLDIVGVVWKKEADKYLVVNVWSIDAKPVVSSAEETGEHAGVQASVYPNLVQDQGALIELSLETPAEISVLLMDGLGRQMALLFEGPLQGGTHQIPLENRILQAPGLYSLIVRTPEGIASVLPFVRQ